MYKINNLFVLELFVIPGIQYMRIRTVKCYNLSLNFPYIIHTCRWFACSNMVLGIHVAVWSNWIQICSVWYVAARSQFRVLTSLQVCLGYYNIHKLSGYDNFFLPSNIPRPPHTHFTTTYRIIHWLQSQPHLSTTMGLASFIGLNHVGMHDKSNYFSEIEELPLGCTFHAYSTSHLFPINSCPLLLWQRQWKIANCFLEYYSMISSRKHWIYTRHRLHYLLHVFRFITQLMASISLFIMPLVPVTRDTVGDHVNQANWTLMLTYWFIQW